MILTVGNKVVYPCQGPCVIRSVVEKVVADMPKSFYQLALLDGSGGELFLPLEKAQDMGLRRLLKRSEIPELLERLMTPFQLAKDWKQRAKDTLKLFASGSAFDLAKIVQSLTELSGKKMLSLRESWSLERARKLLICEISEVTGKTKSAVKEQLDQALEAQKLRGIKGAPKFSL